MGEETQRKRSFGQINFDVVISVKIDQKITAYDEIPSLK